MLSQGKKGATTLGITTLSIKTLIIRTLSIMALIIMTLSITTFSATTFSIMTLSIMTPSVTAFSKAKLSITIENTTFSINDTQHKNKQNIQPLRYVTLLTVTHSAVTLNAGIRSLH
jgi:hypothetical protein